MKNVGSRIYFDKLTGEVLVDTGHRRVLDDFVVPSVEDDFRVFTKLSERNPETVGMLELEYGQYADDFREADKSFYNGYGYRVNPDTQTLEFAYPDPNEPEAPPVFRKPLTQEVDELKQENTLLKAQNNALTERTEFIEDVIAEMAQQVYQ